MGDVEMKCRCPLCKEEYWVTWEPGDGRLEQPTCPADGLPLVALEVHT